MRNVLVTKVKLMNVKDSIECCLDRTEKEGGNRVQKTTYTII